MLPDAVLASVRFTVAATPFWMRLEFTPLRMQVYAPALPAQATDLLAAVAAEPAATPIWDTEAEG